MWSLKNTCAFSSSTSINQDLVSAVLPPRIGNPLFVQNCIIDPTSFAMSTPLILNEILNYLDHKALLVARLVCSSWNEKIFRLQSNKSLHVGERTYLSLNKLFKSSPAYRFPYFDERLASRISFWLFCICGGTCLEDGVLCQSAEIKFKRFCKKFSNQIEDVHLDIHPGFLSVFTNVICYNSPNLKALYVRTSDFYCASFVTLNQLTIPREPFVKPNLEVLIFDAKDSSSVYQVPMQRIISGSPMLTRLEIEDEGNFHPNLENNRNMKSLRLGSSVRKPNFNMENISRFLSPVCDSLVNLYLEPMIDGIDDGAEYNFDSFPTMKKLNDFTVAELLLEDPTGCYFQSYLKTISRKFPNLTNLDLQLMNHYVTDDRKFLSFHFSHLKTMTLSTIEDMSIFCNFSVWFPNLNTLDVGVSDLKDLIFEGLKEMELVHFGLTVNGTCNFADLIVMLFKNMGFFDVMKTFNVYADIFVYINETSDPMSFQSYLGRFDNFFLINTFRGWLGLIAAKMLNVKFSGRKDLQEFLSEVYTYIQDQHLPVEFL